MIFIITLVSVLMACDESIYFPLPGDREKVPEKTKLQKAKDGEWDIDNNLSILCATGEAHCSNEAQVLCYSDHNEQAAFSINNFSQIARLSVAVCLKDGIVLNETPSCESNTPPVCGFKRDVSEFISSIKPACSNETTKDESHTASIVCPFGGNPVCVKRGWDLMPYCINDRNLILSDTWNPSQDFAHFIDFSMKDLLSDPSFKEFGGIACNDKQSAPRCYYAGIDNQTENPAEKTPDAEQPHIEQDPTDVTPSPEENPPGQLPVDTPQATHPPSSEQNPPGQIPADTPQATPPPNPEENPAELTPETSEQPPGQLPVDTPQATPSQSSEENPSGQLPADTPQTTPPTSPEEQPSGQIPVDTPQATPPLNPEQNPPEQTPETSEQPPGQIPADTPQATPAQTPTEQDPPDVNPQEPSTENPVEQTPDATQTPIVNTDEQPEEPDPEEPDNE